MKIVNYAVLPLSLIFISSSNAQERVGAIDFISGEAGVYGVRLGYRPYQGTLTQYKWLGELNFYLEASFNVWYNTNGDAQETDYAFAFSPVISKQFTTVYGYPLHWEAGIGVSLLTEDEFAGKDLGSHFQFEDRLGLTLVLDKLTQQSVSVRYFHYSNAGLGSTNPGLDFFNLSYSRQF